MFARICSLWMLFTASDLTEPAKLVLTSSDPAVTLKLSKLFYETSEQIENNILNFFREKNNITNPKTTPELRIRRN